MRLFRIFWQSSVAKQVRVDWTRVLESSFLRQTPSRFELLAKGGFRDSGLRRGEDEIGGGAEPFGLIAQMGTAFVCPL